MGWGGWGGPDRLPCRAQAKLDWAGLRQFNVKMETKQAGAELGQAQLWLGSRYRQATIAEV